MPTGVQERGTHPGHISRKAEGDKDGRGARVCMCFCSHSECPMEWGMLFCMDSSSGSGTYNALILFI